MKQKLLAESIDAVHFVGIGGVGMSGIAEVLIRSGYTVTGSDCSESPVLRKLQNLGAGISVGHHASNLGQAQLLIFSTAIPTGNPEMREAQSRGIPILHRSELLAELMSSKVGIAVSGTHGKTTTAAMIGTLLCQAGLDPTVVIGGNAPAFNGNARVGQGPHMVVEADESDRSFLRIPGACKVVTNIDDDHMDCYGSTDDLVEAFQCFLNDVPANGRTVVCTDSPLLRRAAKNVQHQMVTYGFGEVVCLGVRNLKIEPFHTRYDCLFRGRSVGRIELPLAGRHNVLNSLAAVAVGIWLEVPFPTIARSLGRFQGAERRLQWKGERGGVGVIDDYAHHPAEIEATLEACRAAGRRIIVIFQPHRYSRTAYLMKRMNECFEMADYLFLTDIYAAGEDPVPGVHARCLASEISDHRQVEYLAGRDEAVRRLLEISQEGDLVLTLGAGDIWKVGEEFLEKKDSK